MKLYSRKRRGWVSIVLFVAVVAVFVFAVSNLKKGNAEEQFALMRKAIDKAIATCYANEGVYPSSIDYIVERYGVQIDTEKYVVDYDASFENIYPSVDIVERAKD